MARDKNSNQVEMQSNRNVTYIRMQSDHDAQQRSEVVEFIKANIQGKMCNTYIPKGGDSTDCECGRQKNEHDQLDSTEVQEEWISENHTEPLPTDSYGTVMFYGFGQQASRNAPYVRVADNCAVEDICTLLFDHWRMQQPKLIISVTGGAKSFFLKDRLKKSFKTGLIKAATTTDAWIISGGTNHGVMEIVGDAIAESIKIEGREKQPVALGIATWGVISNNRDLKRGQDDYTALYSNKCPENDKLTQLNPHHTHFLLVDDGTYSKYGAEIPLRAKLENHISTEKKLRLAETDVEIPVVCLVLEGGGRTLQTAAEAVRNNTPVVVIKGSGRAADLIAVAYEKYGGEESLTEAQKENLKEEIESKLDENVSDIDKHMDNLKCIISRANKDLISICACDNDEETNDIDQAILLSFLKANKTDTASQLKLALAWNRPDVARNKIFSNVNRVKWQKLTLDEVIMTALKEDQHDFVDIFLDHGINLDEFLTVERLKELYTEKKPRFCDAELQAVGSFIQKVLGHLMADELYQGDKFIKNEGSALVGSALLKSLSRLADKEEENYLSEELMEHAMLFEKRACGVMKECYNEDKSMAHSLLVREQTLWNGVTTMMISDQAEHMKFMGESCPQTKLEEIWKGKMALHTPKWKIILSLLFPITLPWIRFKSKNIGFSGDQVIYKKDQKETVNGNRHSHKLYKVSCTPCCKKDTTDSITFCTALYHYHTAPMVKYIYSVLSQIIFLGLFSFFLMTDLYPYNGTQSISIFEWIIWIWTGTLLLEEIRQIIAEDAHKARFKLKGYFASRWNKFDILLYSLLVLTLILRFALKTDDFSWARRSYTCTLLAYYLRFMQMFYVSKRIGPKVIMITKMMVDLAFFFTFFIVFLVSYGVASQALRYPNSPVGWDLLKDVLYHPYWQMYGELLLDTVVEGEIADCSKNKTEWLNNPDVTRCPENSPLAVILFAFYMVMTNILLLNLLIAMFSYTFGKVQEKSKEVWRFYRYQLIHEYFDRPPLAPPLIIISLFVRMIMWCKNHKDIGQISHDFKYVLQPAIHDKLTTFERLGMERYLLQELKESNEERGTKITSAKG